MMFRLTTTMLWLTSWGSVFVCVKTMCRIFKTELSSSLRKFVLLNWWLAKFKVNKIAGVKGAGFVAIIVVNAYAMSFAQAQQDVRVEAPKRGIPAELVDENDYYLHPNGTKIKFYRKKDVYALKPRAAKNRRNAGDPMSQITATFGDRVQRIKGHRLGGMTVVRANQRRASQNQSTNINAKTLAAGNANVSEALPVLANSRGNGDLLISKSLLVELADDVEVDSALEQLNSRFGLSVVRKVNVSGEVYSLQSSGDRDVSQRFALVRRVANSALVAWAQPQFSAKPFKTQFNPSNDDLFGQQWHLSNDGYRGSLCDADCDSAEAWGTPQAGANGVGARAGAGTVIAIIDDGVQLNHSEFNYWQNPGETGPDGNGGLRETNGLDDDGNGYIDDFQGWDFVDDSTSSLVDANSGGACTTANDGDVVIDNDPNVNVPPGQDNVPDGHSFTDCVTVEGDDVAQDDHGTAVAGLAAARADGNGTIGTAFLAEVLPIRLISDFDSNASNDFCARAAEAMEYAGRYADVVNNSWGLEQGTCVMLENAIDDVVAGTVTAAGSNVSKRPNEGSPVIFAAGNNASGWVKVTAQVSAGEHAYEWRVLRSDLPFLFTAGDNDVAYLDDIQFPGQSTLESFEQGLPNDFTTSCEQASCTEGCPNGFFDFCPLWQTNTDTDFVRSGSQSARIGLVDPNDPNNITRQGACAYSYLHTIRDGSAGNISFYVWVDTDQQTASGSDRFEFLIDGVEHVSFGDLPNFIDNNLAFPANLASVIAVGASDSGPLTDLGAQSGDLTQEGRMYYSQYGPELDVLAPSSTQHLGITTTDRFGVNSPGFNLNDDIDGNNIGDPNYTNTFGGTSAAAPIVSGVAAAVIALNPSFSAAQVADRIRNTADEIGTIPYVGGRNDFHGFGRVNMARAVTNSTAPSVSCSVDAFDYSPVPNFPGNDLVLAGFSPVNLDFFGAPSCPAEGPLVDRPGGDFCFPILAQNSNVSVICL